MNINRRTFLKTGGTLLTALLSGTGYASSVGRPVPKAAFGREVQGRCPLCSVGCGVIYRSTGQDNWVVEGDPECPVGKGSLCAAGVSLVAMDSIPTVKTPLYRPPGGREWEDIRWEDAVDIVARRIKDLRDKDLNLNLSEKTPLTNRVSALGILAGGCLTNEQAYTVSKLFRCLGVLKMDSMVRASHGMGVLGLLDVLSFPGATHPLTQIAYSDVVVLMGCNPGQTAPAVSRFLDDVRRRRGTVIVVDTRRTETVKKDDLFLQVRPGTDAAVLGAFIKWIMDREEFSVPDLIKQSDASFMVLSQVMGRYERHSSGKNKNELVTDETLTEPYCVYQRLKSHYERYTLRKIAGITGLDIDLLRRACALIAQTADRNFSASFVLGAGAMGYHSGIQVVRMAAVTQALLGNLDKKGGGVILPAEAGNAQGVCDMGLLSPFFPGYLDLTEEGLKGLGDHDKEAFRALCRAWYPEVDFDKALALLPHRKVDEFNSISNIFQGIDDGDIRALVTICENPASSLPGNALFSESLAGLDLLVVLGPFPDRTSEFWKKGPLREETVKTEVLFIPTETPPSLDGSITDSGRCARRVRPFLDRSGFPAGLLDFMVDLGSSIKSKYAAEGGVLEDAVMEMNWPSMQNPVSIATEINGWRKADQDREILLSPGEAWKKEDGCGNRLYRGWMTEEKWLAERRDPLDTHNIGLFERWGWTWPREIPDPFSRVWKRMENDGKYLRWEGQSEEKYPADDILPSGTRPPIKFWMQVATGAPFPEHYEPFYSPLHDLLTGGRSNPHLSLRIREKNDWGYLFRSPTELLDDYPVIVTSHRTGIIPCAGGITSMVPWLRELGTGRIVEVGMELADTLGVKSGDEVVISSPFYEKGIRAAALVTGRLGYFERGLDRYHIASVTCCGEGDIGINVLTTPAFDTMSGGLETRTFMGKITKVTSNK